jgi:hypothetical protein
MADRPKTTIPPPPPRPAGNDEFSRMVGAALANVSTDISDGSAPPSPMSSVVPNTVPMNVPPAYTPPNPVTVPRGELIPQPVRQGPEMDAQIVYQAMLREQEREMAARPARPDPPSFSHLPGSYMTGAAQPVLVVREGADPLYVEVYHELVRLVAGGLILPYADKTKVLDLTQRLRKAVEFVAPSSPVAGS